MRILDRDSDRALSHVTLYLSKAEAAELRDSIGAVLKDPTKHEHVPGDGHKKEIAVCVYDSAELKSFDERSRRLIEKDV